MSCVIALSKALNEFRLSSKAIIAPNLICNSCKHYEDSDNGPYCQFVIECNSTQKYGYHLPDCNKNGENHGTKLPYNKDDANLSKA